MIVKKFLCISSLYRYTPASCWWTNINTENNYVIGEDGEETPVEDFGMFLILDEEVSSKSADRIFLALMGHAEGENPLVEDKNEDEVYKLNHSSVLPAPTILTRKEFGIFESVIKAKK